MTNHQNEKGAPLLRDEPATPAPALETEGPERPGEASTGYGHRAHSPDPAAQYGFGPGEPRVLPVEKKLRWRVPG
jgi:hypothetical protein